MERYTVKLMRKYGDGESKTQDVSVIVADPNTIKDRAILAAKLMRDKATDGGFYNNNEFYGMVKRLGNVVLKFNIDDGGVV